MEVQLQRRSDGAHTQARTTVRLLESLVRLTQVALLVLDSTMFRL